MTERVVIGDATLYLGDSLEVLPTLADNSIDLILTDPPYYKVKDEPWDRQWETPGGFLDWIGQLCGQWERVLKANGSLYVFASPRMAARVECKIGETFNVIQHITWAKPPYSTKAEMFRKGDLRMFFPSSEAIIFGEHYGADNIAKGEAGCRYCEGKLHADVMQPLRDYLNGERERAGLTIQDIDRETGTAMSSHWFTHPTQWMLPTEKWYNVLRDLFYRMNHGGQYLQRPYEDLRREYEDLRRPFDVTADVPYTDVWTFPTVSAYPGKHPCEKPQAMMEHIIRASSRERAMVLDCFMGSGNVGRAALALGRSFIGIELAEHWHSVACQRIAAAQAQLRLPLEEPAP